jgi:hypothetical protein
VATLAGVQIADRQSPLDSGAAYLLSQKCGLDEVITIASGREVEINRHSPYVVARIKGAANAADAFNESHEAAQQALDLLSARGQAHLSTRKALDECFIWWREPTGQVLRVVSVFDYRVAVDPVVIEQTDKEGNPIRPTVRPNPPVYHESLRYFRLSQITDDLFDSFRNMYLAFESLLESIAPPVISTRSKEGEAKWIRRALTKANERIPLADAFAPTGVDVVTEIYEQIYVRIRCALFHSKTTPRNPRLIPQNLADRARVAQGLGKLTKLVLLILENHLHVRFLSGGVTHAFFNGWTLPLLGSATILVSDSDVPLDKERLLGGIAYADAVEMKTELAPSLSRPGMNFILGALDVTSSRSLEKIARLGIKHENALAFETTLESELRPTGIDRLEAQLGMRLINTREPKHLFWG